MGAASASYRDIKTWFRGGGGTQSRKGINCGQTAMELWLLRANVAQQKGGCLVIVNSSRGAVSISYMKILQKTHDLRDTRKPGW